MTRFLAVPVVIVVSSLLPVLTSGAKARTGLSTGILFILVEASILIPIILSSISIGQEGKSISNVYMLPISAKELVNGKLFFSWVFSAVGILFIALLAQLIAPVGILQFLAVLVAGLFNVLIQGYIGLGAGSRYPNFTVGPRARFITFTGLIIAFIIGLPMTAGTFAPLIVYQAGLLVFLGLGSSGSVLFTIVLTAVVGTVLIVLARVYCMQGVKKLLSNMEA
jgi:hypothetical protein